MKTTLTRSLLTVLTLTVFCSCVMNPARPLTPNAEEVQVRKVKQGVDEDGKEIDSHFVRGSDPLDEEEFYAVISDKASYDQVHGNRSLAGALQGLGLGMLITGIAAAAGAFTVLMLSKRSDDPMAPPPTINIPEESRQIPLYSIYGAGALAIGGGYLFFSQRGHAKGDPMTFDLEHAQASLEKSLYGDNGLSPDDIKKLEINTSTMSPTICSGSSTSIVVGAYDKLGRVIQVGTRGEWFQWSSSPPVQFSDQVVEGDTDKKTLARDVFSPLRSSLATLEQDLSIKLTITQSGLSDDLVLKHDLTCPGLLSYAGASGDWGGDGDSGRDGTDGSSSKGSQSGGQGRDGKNGQKGKKGANVKAEAAWVISPTRGRLLLVVAEANGERKMAIVDPATKVDVSAAGGHGGRGGKGGRGGQGGDAPPFQSCQPGAGGGQGGTGGKGGQGGDGGSVTLEISDDAIRSVVMAFSPGGGGGRGGDAGSGGRHGSKGTCKKGFASDGPNGQGGNGGDGGERGEDGSVNVRVVSAGELDLITAALAENPSLKLDGAAVGPAPRKRR